METLLQLVFFVVFFGGAGWFIWSQMRKQRRREAEIDAFCAERNFKSEQQRIGRQNTRVISPADRSWTLRIGSPFRRSSGKNSTSAPGFTEFRSDTPAWTAGRAVFSQRMPGGLDRLAGSGAGGLVGFLQNAAVKSVLSGMVGADRAAEIADLRHFDAPPGIELTILANSEPQGWDLAALHAAIHGWTPRHSRDRSPPSVLIGPEGFCIRLPHHLSEADDIALFIDHAGALANRLAGTSLRSVC